MHRRAARLGVVALLLIGGVGAGLVTRDVHRQLDALTKGSADVAVQVQALTTTVADIGAAQTAYVAPGQSLDQAGARVTALLQQLGTDAAAIRPELRSVEAAGILQTLTDSTAALVAADRRVRDRVREGDTALAADVIFGDGRTSLNAMRAALGQLGAAEASAVTAERRALEQQMWTAPGVLAVAWLLGLVVLARVPKGAPLAGPAPGPIPQVTLQEPASDLALGPNTIEGLGPSGPGVLTPNEGEGSAPSVDLAAAADLCTAIARVTSTAALPDMLARAATVLDASGIILWMGAGEELFAASAYGYDPRVISRLGPIRRSADNATAAAWRTGEVRTVSGDMMSNGAVVAPMFGPDGCIGVLAAEIRHGREDDAAMRAVTSMIAAQLAVAVSAWPGASKVVSAPARS